MVVQARELIKQSESIPCHFRQKDLLLRKLSGTTPPPPLAWLLSCIWAQEAASPHMCSLCRWAVACCVAEIDMLASEVTEIKAPPASLVLASGRQAARQAASEPKPYTLLTVSQPDRQANQMKGGRC